MSSAIEAQTAKLEIGTGSGGADTITGASQGAICEITAVAHGNAVGDVGTFASIVGMTELNSQTAMIIAKETDAMFFNIDSSGYTEYVSGGTFTPVTFTEVSEVNDFSGPGGSATIIDVTHLQSTAKEKLIGLKDEGQLTLTLNRIFSDTGQAAVETARDTRLLKNWRLTYSDETIQTFSGYVISFVPSGSVDDKVSGALTIEISGEVTTT